MSPDQLKDLLARNPIHPKHGVPVPCILICNVTGKETKYTAPEYIKGKIDAAGSLEKLLDTYTCRGANKAQDPVIVKAKVKETSTRTWKGEKQTTNPTVTPTVDVPVDPKDQIHTEFRLKDGEVCHVYNLRQNPEQQNENIFDWRKKDQNTFAQDK